MSGRLQPRGCSTEYISRERKHCLYRTWFRFKPRDPFSSVNLWYSIHSITFSHPKLSSSGTCQYSGDFSRKPHTELAGSQHVPALCISAFVKFLWLSYRSQLYLNYRHLKELFSLAVRDSNTETGWRNPCSWAGNESDRLSGQHFYPRNLYLYET